MIDIQRGEGDHYEAKCPQCSSIMANMGLDFEAPKMTDHKKWAQVKNLYQVGITFHSCGCTGPGYIPANKEQLISYFKERINDYSKQLAFWRNRIEPLTKGEMDHDQSKNWEYIVQIEKPYKKKGEAVKNEDAINFWILKIKEVEEKLKIAHAFQ